MGRPRKQIQTDHVYEICMKTRLGLPFVCTLYMRLILEGIIARVQRDSKVVLSHLIFMGNHPHIFVLAKDAEQCKNFYGELQKQVTEAVKKLIGLTQLNLWKANGTSVVEYRDLATCIERIAYLYANPAKAHLVDTIDRYPGLSSWQAFRESPHTLSAKSTKTCPWIRYPTIEKLPTRSVLPVTDRHITNGLQAMAKLKHELVFEPNAWMQVLGVKDEEVEQVNCDIVKRLRQMEEDARKTRIQKGWRVKGAEKLKAEPITLNYRSSSERRISVYSVDPELRKQMIREYREFCDRCDECYQLWRKGDYQVQWPPGAFRPSLPPV